MPNWLTICLAVAYVLYGVRVHGLMTGADKKKERRLPRWLWALFALAWPAVLVGGMLLTIHERAVREGKEEGR